MPRIPRILAAPRAIGRRAVASDFGGGGSEAAAAIVAGEIGDAAQGMFEADQSSKVSAGVQGAASEINSLRLEVEKNPNLDEREDIYRKSRQEILGRHRGTILSEAFKNQFDSRIFSISERSLLQVREGIRAGKLGEIRGETLTAVDELARLVGESTDPTIRQGYQDQLDETLRSAVETGAFTPAEVAKVQIDIKAAIRAAELKVETQQIADDLEAKHPRFADQVKAAKDKYSGERLDLVVARLKGSDGIKQKARREAEAALLDTLVSAAAADKLTYVQALEAAANQGLSAAGLAAVNRVIAQTLAGKQPASGGTRYWELRRERENDPDTFRNREINNEGGLITTDEVQFLRGEQLKADTDALETYIQKVDRALGSLKLPVLPADMADDPDNAPRSRLFRQRIEAAKKAERIDKKRRLTGPEIDEIITFGMSDVALDDEAFFRDDDKRARFTVIGIDDIGDVPPESEKRARAALRRDGNSFPTTDQIRGTYLELLLEGEE